MTETSPELSGLLYKRRGGFGKIMPNAWQYRFFALSREGILQYFDTEIPDTDSLDSRARGRLDLRSVNFEISLEFIEGAPTQFSIQILVPNEETWKMCALTKEDQARWIRALEKYQNEKLAKVTTNIALNLSEEGLDNKKQIRQLSPREALDESVLRTTEPPKSESVVSTSTFSDNEKTQPTSSPQDNIVQKKNLLNRRNSSNRRRLKLASSKGFIDQENGELFLVLVILNFSLMGILTSGSFLTVSFYLVVSNLVVYHTLRLRGKRGKEGSPETKQLPAITPVLQAISTSSVASPDPIIVEEVLSSSEVIKTNTAEEKPTPGFLSIFPFCLTSTTASRLHLPSC